MGLKHIVAIALLVFLGIFGINLYNNKQSQKSIIARNTESEILRAENIELEKGNQRRAQIELENKQSASMLRENQKMVAAQNMALEIEDSTKLNDIMRRWIDISTVANRTSRITLSPVVKDMQALRREADSLIVTQCLTAAKTNLLIGMDSEISAYLEFMAKSTKSIAKEVLAKQQAHARYDQIVKRCVS